MSWFIIDANISGDTKEACTGSAACWTYIKIWLRRFTECILMICNGE